MTALDDDLADAVQQRLSQRVATAQRRRAMRRANRAERARRRKYGLRQRHRRKLAKTNGHQNTDPATRTQHQGVRKR